MDIAKQLQIDGPAIVGQCNAVYALKNQWRRHELESGEHTSSTNLFVVPLHFLAVQVQLVVLLSAFGQFLVCCSSTYGALRI